MIEIQCPRCGQYWYDKDEEDEGGRNRLCDRCADHLRYKRRQRGLIDIPFVIVAAALFGVDLMMIALSGLRPHPFAKVMLVYGALLVFGGMFGLFGIQFERDAVINIDWKFGRWALLIAISGMVCLLAAGAFLGFK